MNNEMWSIGKGKYVLYTESYDIAKEISQWTDCKIVGTYYTIDIKKPKKGKAYHVQFPRNLYNRVASLVGLPQRADIEDA